MDKVNKQVKAPGGFEDHPEHINKEGRPDAGWTWRDLFLKIADEKKNQLTRKEIAAKKIWEKMEEGDIKAFEKIADRMEGKVAQGIEVGGSGEDIVIKVKYE